MAVFITFEVSVAQSHLTFCDPMACSLPRLLCPWGFSRQEYWSWLPFPSSGDLVDPGIKPRSPPLQADSLPSELPGKPFITFISCQIGGQTIPSLTFQKEAS